MANIFNKSLGAAFKSLKGLRGLSASIKVSEATTLTTTPAGSPLIIVPARTERENVGDEGQIINTRFQDWLIEVSDLAGNEPRESWEITVESEVYKLTPLDDNKSFRFHDAPRNQIYRVHSTLKDGEPG